MRNVVRLMAAFAAAAVSTPLTAATYLSNQQIGAERLSLSITTDGAQGEIRTENLLSYTLSYGSYRLSGEGLGYQGGLYIAGRSPLFVEGDELIFDSSTFGGLVLYAEQGASAFIASSGLDGLNPYQSLIVNGSDIVTVRLPRRYVLAAALPEPATWLLMFVGFGVVGGVLRWRPPLHVSAIRYG